MAKVIHRPTTDVETHSPTATTPGPLEVEREGGRQLPPPQRPRRYFRWLGWLLALAAIAVFAVIVYNDVTSDGEVAAPSNWAEITADMQWTQPVEIPPFVPAPPSGKPVLQPPAPLSLSESLARAGIPDFPTSP